jgi:hypothetical protein
LPSRCIRRYRLPSRCTRQKFHARPEQGNGPAADGASFSLTLKFIGVRKEPLFPSGTKTIRGLGNRSARFHHPHPSAVCVPRAFPGSHLCCGRPDCVAGHVRLELRNVGTKYSFERSHRFREIQPNSGDRDYSRLSCGTGETPLGPNATISADMSSLTR